MHALTAGRDQSCARKRVPTHALAFMHTARDHKMSALRVHPRADARPVKHLRPNQRPDIVTRVSWPHPTGHQRPRSAPGVHARGDR
eukprot:2542851-Rhodomonas_salina.2